MEAAAQYKWTNEGFLYTLIEALMLRHIIELVSLREEFCEFYSMLSISNNIN
jgi:hypothetical protein